MTVDQALKKLIPGLLTIYGGFFGQYHMGL